MSGNNRHTRRKVLALTGAGVAGGLAGCTGGGDGGGGATPTPQVKTVVKTVEGEDETVVKTKVVEQKQAQVHLLTDYANQRWKQRWKTTIVPQFQEKTGTPVNVEYTGFQGPGDKRLATLLQAGNPPETFTGSLFQNGELLVNGNLARTTETVRAIEEQSGSVIREPIEVDGDFWMVPHGLYLSAINYRTDVYEELGLDPPETAEQYLQNAKVIDESDMDIRGCAVGGARDGMSSFFPEQWLKSWGAAVFRWKNKDEGIAEVGWPKQETLDMFDFLKELSQYSPDPSQVSWGSALKLWAGGRVAQMPHLNAWPAGVAAQAGATDVAKNTGVVPFPKKEGVDPAWGSRGGYSLDGHSIISAADNPGGFRELLKFMYRNPKVAARNYIMEPTRFIPAYGDIMDTDTYQNAEIFKKVPHLLDLNKQLANDIAPMVKVSEVGNATSPGVIYEDRFPITGNITNQILVSGRDPEKAYEDLIQRYQKRLDEGRELAKANF